MYLYKYRVIVIILHLTVTMVTLVVMVTVDVVGKIPPMLTVLSKLSCYLLLRMLIFNKTQSNLHVYMYTYTYILQYIIGQAYNSIYIITCPVPYPCL